MVTKNDIDPCEKDIDMFCTKPFIFVKNLLKFSVHVGLQIVLKMIR